MSAPMRVLIDGEPVPDEEAVVSVFDWALLRGFGAFELLRSYGGFPFRLPQHLARLQQSLTQLQLPPVDGPAVEAWVKRQAEAGGDCFVRVIVTAGSRDPLFASPGRVIVLWERLHDLPAAYRFLPVTAPWHASGHFSELTGAKTTSYAPNMAATLEAQRQGFHDALLVSPDGTVLEGPTFALGWVIDGALELPSLELGVLGSITREALVDAAGRLDLPVRTGRFSLDRVHRADEALAASTTRGVMPVEALGEQVYPLGPVVERLGETFLELVETERAAESG